MDILNIKSSCFSVSDKPVSNYKVIKKYYTAHSVAHLK